MPNWIIIVIIAFFAFDILFVSWILFKRSRRKKLDSREIEYIKSHWIRIIDSFESHTVQAILDADKLLDYALSKHGFDGNLGEKLKKAGARFSDLNGIWSAHKLRNSVAHELGMIDVKAAKSALVSFKRALNDLGASL